MKIILGVNFGHADASAAIVVDGVVCAAIANERLGKRIKNDPSFPMLAIERLLNHVNLKVEDVDVVAIPRNPHLNLSTKFRYACTSVEAAKKSFNVVAKKFLKPKDDWDWREMLIHHGFRGSVVAVEHHLAHIASSYYCADTDKATLGFSFDGSGDFVSCMFGSCEGKKINVTRRIFLPDSLGFFYTAMCQFIGFQRFGEEYKVMGLAPYGENRYSVEMDAMVRSDKFGNYKTSERYFSMHDSESIFTDVGRGIKIKKMYTKAVEELFRMTSEEAGGSAEIRADIARSTQIKFEEAVMKLLTGVRQNSSIKQIAMAGGCALNGVNNARILRDFDVEKQFLHPASSDDGTAVGAALWAWHNVCDGKKVWSMSDPYLGFEYETKSIAQKSRYYQGELSSDKDLICSAANDLESGKVIGWFQGRSEWGPRSLGNRSILANPMISDMKDRINEKIKRRESFRPFAPSILKDDVGIYFEQSIHSPYMMHVVKWRDEYRALFPSVVHVDGTGRLQTVSRGDNPLYFDLLSEFKRRTGHGVILNTSFNENEPVVEEPIDALNCFERTDLDVCYLGKSVLRK